MEYVEALEILKLSEEFCDEDLKKAYKSASKIHHPDLGGSTEMMQKVNEAYDLLLKEQHESKLQQKFLECVGSTNLNAISECISYLDDLPYEVIESVLIRTSRIKNPNWAYAKVILDDYVRKRIDSLAKVEIANKKPSDNNKREYKETDFDSLYANKGG